MPKTRIALGVPFYGPQSAKWWIPLVKMVGLFPAMDLEYAGIITSGVSTTDRNRNDIANIFLDKAEADWLYWLDADTVTPSAAIPRLLKADKTLISGLYYGKGEGHVPIAYAWNDKSKGYASLEKVRKWERGEILPVDAAGMGAMLMHRSVLEDIKKKYTPWQYESGGVRLIHNDDTKTPPKEVGKKHKLDGKFIEGQLRERLHPVQFEDYPFPFFMSEYGRTEDMPFFERAKRVGHQCWLDTSIECIHLRDYEGDGAEFRREHGV